MNLAVTCFACGCTTGLLLMALVPSLGWDGFFLGSFLGAVFGFVGFRPREVAVSFRDAWRCQVPRIARPQGINWFVVMTWPVFLAWVVLAFNCIIYIPQGILELLQMDWIGAGTAFLHGVTTLTGTLLLLPFVEPENSNGHEATLFLEALGETPSDTHESRLRRCRAITRNPFISVPWSQAMKGVAYLAKRNFESLAILWRAMGAFIWMLFDISLTISREVLVGVYSNKRLICCIHGPLGGILSFLLFYPSNVDGSLLVRLSIILIGGGLSVVLGLVGYRIVDSRIGIERI